MSKKGDAAAAAELLVAGDLLRKGQAVFRALSAHAPCDLVVIDDTGGITRIEVRTANARKDGTLSPSIRATDSCDLYAFVCGDRIEYVLPEVARVDVRSPRQAAAWRSADPFVSGVCPVSGCKQWCADLSAHIGKWHPDLPSPLPKPDGAV